MTRLRFPLIICCVTFAAICKAQDTSCGIVWYPPIQVSPDSEPNVGVPILAVQGDTVHITWGWSIFNFPYVRSTDGGATFEPLRPLVHDSSSTAFAPNLLASGSRLYAFWSATPQNNETMMRSDDRGATWTAPRILIDSTPNWLVGTARGDKVVVGVSRTTLHRNFLVSTDAGYSWVFQSPEIIGNNPSIALTRDRLYLTVGWLYDSAGYQTQQAVQYKTSTDLGATWSDSIALSTVKNNLAQEPAIAADDNGNLIVSWQDGKYGCQTLFACSIIERHLRAGDSLWSLEGVMTDQPDGIPEGIPQGVAVQNSFMATTWTEDVFTGGGTEYFPLFIRLTSDGGTTWCPPYKLTPDTASASAPSVATSGSTIHVVYYMGVGSRAQIFYRRGLMLTTSVTDKQQIAREFGLSQNYPNPFNPSTSITYELDGAAEVNLVVYDLLGRQVAVLADGRETVGWHSVRWNAGGFPSGVYYYRLSAFLSGNRMMTATKKMALVR